MKIGLYTALVLVWLFNFLTILEAEEAAEGTAELVREVEQPDTGNKFCVYEFEGAEYATVQGADESCPKALPVSPATSRGNGGGV